VSTHQYTSVYVTRRGVKLVSRRMCEVQICYTSSPWHALLTSDDSISRFRSQRSTYLWLYRV